MTARRSNGIRTLSDIRDRCRIDEETGCWVWAGALARSTKRKVSPTTRVWFPHADGGGELTTAQRAGWLLSGRDLAPGHVVWREVCGNNLCVNPEHCRAGTRQDMHAAVAASDRLKGHADRKIANAKNRECLLTPVDVVRQAEAMFAAGMLQREVREALGFASNTASRIRRGIHPNSTARVKVLRGASVFTMGMP